MKASTCGVEALICIEVGEIISRIKGYEPSHIEKVQLNVNC